MILRPLLNYCYMSIYELFEFISLFVFCIETPILITLQGNTTDILCVYYIYIYYVCVCTVKLFFVQLSSTVFSAWFMVDVFILGISKWWS